VGLSGSGAGHLQVTVDTGVADVVEAVDYVVGTGPGMGALIARLTDTSNHFVLLTVNNTLQLFRKQAGTYTLLVSQALPAALAVGSVHRLEIHTTGTLLEGFWDNVKLLQAVDSFNRTATRHGLDWNSAFDATTKYDNFLVTPNTAAVSPFVINATFDSTINNDANATAIKNKITEAIAVYQSMFRDPITVNITFAKMGTGLGQSLSFFCNVPYATYRAALAADTTSVDDATAMSHLPSSATNPVNGNSTINVKTANLRAVGITGCNTATDGTISVNTSLTTPGSSGTTGEFDLLAVVEHEIDEVLGLGSALPTPQFSTVFPHDLYRYNQSGTRIFTTGLGNTSFFSIDGPTKIAQFNQDPGADGHADFGDWQSSPLPAGVLPQVQDAFATRFAHPTLGPSELRSLDVIGYDRAGGAQLVLADAASSSEGRPAAIWGTVSDASPSTWLQVFLPGAASNAIPGVASVVAPTTSAGASTSGTSAIAFGSPAVAAIAPASGPSAGGTQVTITGTNFRSGATVTFGGTPAANVVVVSETTITATTASRAPGTVGVAVTNADTKTAASAGGFTFIDPPTALSITPSFGPVEGGTAVVISGAGFATGAAVTIGGASAASVTVSNESTITAVTGAGTAGLVSVVITNPDTQNATLASAFSYSSGTPPMVISVVPASGSTAGGTTVTVTGSNLLAGVSPSIGGVPATNVTLLSATTFTATTGAHAAGTTNVDVRNPDALSGSLPNGFIYVEQSPGTARQTVSSSEVSEAVDPSSPDAPGPPSRLAASTSGSTVTFAWSAPSSGGPPTEYMIAAGSSAGLSDLADFSTGSTATSFSVGAVPAGTFFVRVRATNNHGTSAPSNEVRLVVGESVCSDPPSAPTGLRFTLSGSTVTLTWNASAGSPRSYLIEEGSFSGGTNLKVSDSGSTSTSVAATDVGPGTYFVRLRAQNACGTSRPSNEVVIVVR
jgi:IPT/TIG domain